MATQTLYALFQTVSDAERAIGALEDHGIHGDSIGIAQRRAAEQPESNRVRDDFERVAKGGTMGEGEVSYETLPGALPPAVIASTVTPTSSVDTSNNVETVGKEGITTTTPEDAAAGAALGTGVGLIAGLLAAAAAVTIPGIGLVLGGGILASAIGATAATTAAGAVAGGVAGYLRDMGMPEQAATHYEDRLREGDYLVSILIDSTQYDAVTRILEKYNAAGIDDQYSLPLAATPEEQALTAEEIRRITPLPGVLSEPVETRHIFSESDEGVPIISSQNYLSSEDIERSEK